MIFTATKPFREDFYVDKKIAQRIMLDKDRSDPLILLFLLENTVSAFFSVPTRIVLSGVLFVAATLTDLLDGRVKI